MIHNLQRFKNMQKKTGKLEIYTLTPQERKLWETKLRAIYPKFYGTIGKDLIEKTIKAGE